MPSSLDPDHARRFVGLIWVQIVCKGKQQTTLVSKEFMTRIQLTRNSEFGIKSIKYLPAKAISLINFVNSRRQVQDKNVGHYLMAEFSFEIIVSQKYVFQEYK